MALSARQARFVAEYLKTHNGRVAAVAAGYSVKTATVQASRLLTHPDVVNRLEQARVNVMEEVSAGEASVARVVKELTSLAYYDHNSIKPAQRFDAKVPALKLLASHLNMIQQQPQQPGNLGFQINIIMGDD